MELENAKCMKARRSIIDIGSIAATLEGKIARDYLVKNEKEKAIINLISQASCLCDAERYTEALRIFKKAESITSIEKAKLLIRELVSSISDRAIWKDNPFHSLRPNIENNVLLRKPQIDSYIAAKDYFSKYIGHVIVQLPVGCGKTGSMSLMPFGISDGRVLCIAPNLEIRRNLYENLNYYGQNSFLKRFKVLINGHGPSCAYLDNVANIFDCDSSDILVTNIQQLVSGESKKWLSLLSPDFFDMIVIDEAHHNIARTWQNSISRFPDAKIISFTATPLRSDGRKVDGNRIYRFPIEQAIRDGFIKDIASRRLEPQEIKFTFKGESRTANLNEVLSLRDEDWFSRGVALSRECNETIVDASIQSMNELRDSGVRHQIIGVACSIDHARSIRSLYLERGLNADVLHSNMDIQEQDRVRSELKNQKLDVIIQVQMLGEGADYPLLSVAAIFRPFRHLMPYVQFIGRIMRVIKQNAPGELCNRGFVVSHIGLNVDRWWKELRTFDSDDEEFFAEISSGSHEFLLKPKPNGIDTEDRVRFKPAMRVIEEALVQFIQEHFLQEDARLVIDDLIQAMNMRGIDIEALGLTRADLEEKLINISKEKKRIGEIQKIEVSPQEARKEARTRLDERVRSASKQLLNELHFRIAGFEIPKLFPEAIANANLPAAIVLLNKEVCEYLKVGPKERDLLTESQLRDAHDNMDEIIDILAEKIRSKRRK